MSLLKQVWIDMDRACFQARKKKRKILLNLSKNHVVLRLMANQLVALRREQKGDNTEQIDFIIIFFLSQGFIVLNQGWGFSWFFFLINPQYYLFKIPNIWGKCALRVQSDLHP